MTQTTAIATTSLPSNKTIPFTNSTTPTLCAVVPTPHIAVTPSLSIEKEEREKAAISASGRRSRALSPSRRKELRKNSPIPVDVIEPLVHSRRYVFL